ncbi:hypothetical protein IT415_01340 [bacterium]|nr:hypothetical protein [bacterium]
MLHILRRVSLLIGAVSASLLLFAGGHAQAATNGRMIDDTVFDASSTMSAADIQNFLNSFPNSCLKNWTDDMPVADPTTAYFNYSGTGTAAQIIRRVADNYGINPRVLLTKLEQEENLVTGNAGCQMWRLASAVGFHCYDGANPRTTVYRGVTIQTCVDQDANMGVGRQLSKGGWLLKWAKERANGNLSWLVPEDAAYTYNGPMTQGNRKRCGSCNTIYYDGYWNGVYLETGATASLYNYTPYLNQAFDEIWEGWWGAGSTVGVPYQWQYVGQSSSSGAIQGATQKSTWTVSARNTGNTIWTKSGSNPIRLGTTRSLDRSSQFWDSSWPSCNRAALLNEESVAPGQVGTFTFITQAPGVVGNYNEYFNLVAEGITWLNDPGLYFGISVSSANISGTIVSNTLPTNMAAGSSATGTLGVRNDGNISWYKSGRYPMNLGTANPTDRSSKFYAPSWINSARLANMNEATVAPGQVATFTVTLKAPAVNGVYTEYFSRVIDGFSWAPNALTHTITVTGGQAPPSNSLGTNQSLSVNQILRSGDSRFALILQSDGNLVLYSPNRALWASRTSGRSSSVLIMQSDGNLVAYDTQGRAYWASWTQGNPGSTLVVQDDGNLVIYSAQGRPLWYTRTAGQL